MPDPAAGAVYQAVAQRYGSERTVAEVTRRFHEAFRRLEAEEWGTPQDWRNPDRLRTDEGHERRRWRRIVEAVFDDLSSDERRAAWEELFADFARPAAWRCFPEVGPVLAALRARGYQLAAATNFDARFHALWAGLPELQPIELRVVSSEVGYRKPSVHFYRALAARCSVAPAEVLMVGDDEANDVQGARRAGLRTIRLCRHRRTEPTPSEEDTIADLRGLLGFGIES